MLVATLRGEGPLVFHAPHLRRIVTKERLTSPLPANRCNVLFVFAPLLHCSTSPFMSALSTEAAPGKGRLVLWRRLSAALDPRGNLRR